MKRSFLLVLLLAATAVSSASSSELVVPALKPGLWEWHYKSSAGPSAVPPTMCIGAMPQQQRELELANVKSRCSKWDSRQLDGKWVVDAVCTTARGVTITKHVVTSLTGDTVHEENTVAARGLSSSSDGKWLGPCKPGQKPDVLK